MAWLLKSKPVQGLWMNPGCMPCLPGPRPRSQATPVPVAVRVQGPSAVCSSVGEWGLHLPTLLSPSSSMCLFLFLVE